MDKERERGRKRDAKTIIQSILLTQEQHFVLDFREGGEKRRGVVGEEQKEDKQERKRKGL